MSLEDQLREYQQRQGYFAAEVFERFLTVVESNSPKIPSLFYYYFQLPQNSKKTSFRGALDTRKKLEKMTSPAWSQLEKTTAGTFPLEEDRILKGQLPPAVKYGPRELRRCRNQCDSRHDDIIIAIYR